jgi:hypothetical protein
MTSWTSRGAPIMWEQNIDAANGQRGGLVTFDGNRCLEYWVPLDRAEDAARVEVESEVFAKIAEALMVTS